MKTRKKHKIKDQFLSGQDHEDWENDYYAQRAVDQVLAFVSLIGLILTGILLIAWSIYTY